MGKMKSFLEGIVPFLQTLAKGWNTIQWGEIFSGLFGIAIIVLLLIFSGIIAAHFMEKSEKMPKKHFWLGFFLPVIYPLLAYLMYLKFAKDRKEADEARKAEEKAKEETEKANPAESSMEMGKELLKKLRTKEDGSPDGPFEFSIKGGTVLKVATILEAQDMFAVLELPDDGSGKSESERMVRLPYTRIESIKKIS